MKMRWLRILVRGETNNYFWTRVRRIGNGFPLLHTRGSDFRLGLIIGMQKLWLSFLQLFCSWNNKKKCQEICLCLRWTNVVMQIEIIYARLVRNVASDEHTKLSAWKIFILIINVFENVVFVFARAGSGKCRCQKSLEMHHFVSHGLFHLKYSHRLSVIF